jgi:hypothetical protein
MVWSGGSFERAVRRGESPAAPLTALQIEAWQLLRAEWAADADAQAAWRQWEAGRAAAQPEAAALAAAFLDDRLDAAALREAFDRRTRAGWDAFGLRGPAGAMFLNRLVKRARPLAGGDAALDATLRAALRVPAGADAARARLAAFVAQLRADGLAAQPAIAVAFATSWWQLQAPEAWPAFRASTRRALAAEEAVFVAGGDAAADYAPFRAAVLALGGRLALHPWAFEHLCRWHLRRQAAAADEPDDAGAWAGAAPRRGAPARAPAPPAPAARLRARRPASAPRGRVAEQPAAEPSPTDGRSTDGRPSDARDLAGHPAGRVRPPRAGASRPRPPSRPSRPGTGGTSSTRASSAPRRRTPRCSGCSPISGGGSAAASGSPPTTTAGAGAARRSGPSASSACRRWASIPTRNASSSSSTWCGCAARRRWRRPSRWSAPPRCTPGCCAWPTSPPSPPTSPCRCTWWRPTRRLDKVRRELRRPALRALGLDRRCGFFSAEALAAAAPDIARWASGPRAIDRLAERLDG